MPISNGYMMDLFHVYKFNNLELKALQQEKVQACYSLYI